MNSLGTNTTMTLIQERDSKRQQSYHLRTCLQHEQIQRPKPAKETDFEFPDFVEDLICGSSFISFDLAVAWNNIKIISLVAKAHLLLTPNFKIKESLTSLCYPC